jgi:hypothetical protein
MGQHYPQVDFLSIVVTGIILYLVFYGVAHTDHRLVVLGCILVMDLLLFLNDSTVDPAVQRPQRVQTPQKANPVQRRAQHKADRVKRRVHFAPEVKYHSYEPKSDPVPVQRRQQDFFPPYMNYFNRRKPEVSIPSPPVEIDNRKEYDAISTDNISVLSSFADSFAPSDSVSDN